MLKKVVLAGISALLLLGARPASATTVTFDFESLSPATGLASVSLTLSGLTATFHRQDNAAELEIDGFVGPPNWGSASLLPGSVTFTDPGATLVINFSSPIISSLIQFGDFDADDDGNVVLTAFAGLDGTGANLGSASVPYPASLDVGNGDADIRSLTVNAAGIRSLTIIGGGAFPNSLFFDNLVVSDDQIVGPPVVIQPPPPDNTPTTVPEPASLLLFGTGLVARQLWMRRNAR
jgi:hypothetical protein